MITTPDGKQFENETEFHISGQQLVTGAKSSPSSTNEPENQDYYSQDISSDMALRENLLALHKESGDPGHPLDWAMGLLGGPRLGPASRFFEGPLPRGKADFESPTEMFPNPRTPAHADYVSKESDILHDPHEAPLTQKAQTKADREQAEAHYAQQLETPARGYSQGFWNTMTTLQRERAYRVTSPLNLVTGESSVSSSTDHPWAERLAQRVSEMTVNRITNPATLARHEAIFRQFSNEAQPEIKAKLEETAANFKGDFQLKPSNEISERTHKFNIQTADGQNKGYIRIDPSNPEHLHVKYVRYTQGDVGTPEIRAMMRQLKQLYPEAKDISGWRISGAKAQSVNPFLSKQQTIRLK